jgi:hypothetical protein
MHIGYWWESWKEGDHWEDHDNIKMYLREKGWDGMNWIDLDHNRDRWRARVHGNEPSGSIKCW